MKVQYLLNFSQINAIDTLTGISGTVNTSPEDIKLVEYNISEELKSMLDTLLSQNGFIKEAMSWPSKGDTYYYIGDSCCVAEDIYDEWELDNARRAIGNMFKTREEAAFELERLNVLNQLKSLSDDDSEWDSVTWHYDIIYRCDDNKLNVVANCIIKPPHEYWFKSEASAEAAIKAIGEDKLKKYVFNVKD